VGKHNRPRNARGQKEISFRFEISRRTAREGHRRKSRRGYGAAGSMSRTGERPKAKDRFPLNMTRICCEFRSMTAAVASLPSLSEPFGPKSVRELRRDVADLSWRVLRRADSRNFMLPSR
jgi:hypothetical protein